MNIAFIPVRGGSKGVHKKNMRNLNGVPLLQYSLYTLDRESTIDLIVVSTDDYDIRECAKSFGSDKIQIVDRSPEVSNDTASTESTVLEYFNNYMHHSDSHVFVVQVTNPFLREVHVREAHLLLKDGGYDSVVTVTRDHRFLWEKGGKPINYDPALRPRRQEWPGVLMENGAMYATKLGCLMESKCLLSGNIVSLQMDYKWSQLEVDEIEDLYLAEMLLRMDGQRLEKIKKRVGIIK